MHPTNLCPGYKMSGFVKAGTYLLSPQGIGVRHARRRARQKVWRTSAGEKKRPLQSPCQLDPAPSGNKHRVHISSNSLCNVHVRYVPPAPPSIAEIFCHNIVLSSGSRLCPLVLRSPPYPLVIPRGSTQQTAHQTPGGNNTNKHAVSQSCPTVV